MEENENVITNPEDNDLIAALQKQKENSVERSRFDKVVEERNRLLQAYVDGSPVSAEIANPAPKADINALRNKLFSEDAPELSNLEYAKTALELRNAIIETDGFEADPFVPHGKKVVPTRDDYEAAQRVADAFQSCIDYANGDSEVFTNELQRITRDTGVMGKR